MILQQVKLTNFRCFEDLVFDLPSANGLYLLTGKNQQNTRLGANGLGKSTIFDAICFALYGKTSREHKSGRLLNRNSGKGYKVELVFDKGTLIRSWGPIKITWNGEEIDDKKVLELFNMTFEQFLYAIYQRQEANYFVDLTPTAKLNFLSDLFELDLWIKCAEICKTKTHAKEVEVASVKTLIGTLENAYVQREKTIFSMGASIKDWESQHEDGIIGLETELSEQRNKLKDTPTLQDIEMLELELKAEEEQVRQELRKASDSVQRAQRIKNEISIEIKMSSTKLERLLDKESKECPECNQVVTADHIEPIALKLDGEIQSAESRMVEIEQELAQLKEQQAEVEDSYTELQDLQADTRREIAQMRAEIAMQTTTVNAINRLTQKLEQERSKTCPLMNVKNNSIEENRLCLVKIEEANALLKAHEFEIERYTFWVKHFALVRLSILSDIASELELHFNEAFSRMGLIDYRVTVETERELKSSEGTKKEITMRIFHDDTEIDYDTCSGGERQRIRLATSVGTADMIKARKGIDWCLRLIDEASQGLSEEGVVDMLDLSHEVGRNNVTLMAEHRVSDSGMFDGMFVITKKEDGNSVGVWA